MELSFYSALNDTLYGKGKKKDRREFEESVGVFLSRAPTTYGTQLERKTGQYHIKMDMLRKEWVYLEAYRWSGLRTANSALRSWQLFYPRFTRKPLCRGRFSNISGVMNGYKETDGLVNAVSSFTDVYDIYYMTIWALQFDLIYHGAMPQGPSPN